MRRAALHLQRDPYTQHLPSRDATFALGTSAERALERARRGMNLTAVSAAAERYLLCTQCKTYCITAAGFIRAPRARKCPA